MSMFPWRPQGSPFNIGDQIEQAFSQLIHEKWGRAAEWHPAVDIHETDDAYLLEADLPGVKPKDVEVRVENHTVTICGQRRAESIVRSAHAIRVERTGGHFCRVFTVEHDIDVESIEVMHEEGIYQIRLPKETSRD